jgi:hypothetical protein
MASVPLTPTPYRKKIPRLQKYGKKKQEGPPVNLGRNPDRGKSLREKVCHYQNFFRQKCFPKFPRKKLF